MKTVNSISGGKTSAYIAANYPADYDVFALVRTNKKSCEFKDSGIRKIVSEKIGCDFVGTLEMDDIIYTMLDLEQFIGRKITWLTGNTFEEIVLRKNGNIYLPNKTQRFCTIEMKMKPIMQWWYNEVRELCEMRIGFRANEMRRSKSMMKRLRDGIQYDKFVVGNKNDRNVWKEFGWRVPSFPLILDNIYKDTIENYWKDKDVRFAELNNCVGCFHRNNILLNKLWNSEHKNKMQFFSDLENSGYKNSRFKSEITYEQIKKHKPQHELSFDDFSECDSGYCGL